MPNRFCQLSLLVTIIISQLPLVAETRAEQSVWPSISFTLQGKALLLDELSTHRHDVHGLLCYALVHPLLGQQDDNLMLVHPATMLDAAPDDLLCAVDFLLHLFRQRLNTHSSLTICRI